MSQLAIIPVVLLMTQSKWFFQERISSIKTPKCLMYLLCSKLTLFFTQIFLFVEDNVLLFWKGFLTREKDRKQNEEMMCVIWKKNFFFKQGNRALSFPKHKLSFLRSFSNSVIGILIYPVSKQLKIILNLV